MPSILQKSGILQKFGGKILARGGKFKVLEGPEKFRRFVVIEFPSFEEVVACYESPEYLEAAAHRQKDGASELEIAIVMMEDRSPDGAKRHPGRAVPHFAPLNAGYLLTDHKWMAIRPMPTTSSSYLFAQ